MSDEEGERTDEEKPDLFDGTEKAREGSTPAVKQDEDVVPENSNQPGALAVVLEKYEPEEFNEFIDHLVESYKDAQKTGYEYRKSIQTRAILVVLVLFVGLIALTRFTNLSGESVVFFAGIIVGYIMSLANNLS